MAASLSGLLYLKLVSFVGVYTNVYQESSGIAGLHYLAIVFGSIGDLVLISNAEINTKVILQLAGKLAPTLSIRYTCV